MRASLGVAEARHRVIYFDETDSTNTRALAAVAAGTARDGDAFVAGRQTAGRGSDGKPWSSGEPVGLWMSVVLLEPLRTSAATALLPAVALATVLRREFGVDAHVKWPNDVLVGQGDAARKLAGILIESTTGPAGRGWVVGVGVNLGQPAFAPPLDAIATSVLMLTGRAPHPAEVFGPFVRTMDELDVPGVDLPARWTALSHMPGQTVRLTRGGRTSAVYVEGVDDRGHLCIVSGDGRRERLVGVTGIDIDPRY